MIRAFVALDLDDASLDALGAMGRALRESAPAKAKPRWTTREQTHVTVKFLGSATEEQAAAMGVSLRSIAGATVPRARVVSFGAFPYAARASVLLATIDDPGDLARIARATDDRACELGFLRESRPYLAHATFARLRIPVDVRAWIEGIPFTPFDLGVRALTLYQSVLSSAGARYTPLASATFS